jgi:dihydrofolate reductase
MKGEFADKFNSMPKYVVSSTLERAEWSNSTILSGNLVDEITKLREAPGGELLINGSATLVQALLERDLLDEIRLMVFPVVLGAGRRLFGELSEKKPLRLADSQTVGAGITVLTLQPRAEAADPAGADA